MQYHKALWPVLTAAALSLAAVSCSSSPDSQTSGAATSEETQAAETTLEEPSETESSNGESGRTEDERPEGTATGSQAQADPATVFGNFLAQEWGEEGWTDIFSYAFEDTGNATAHPETAALSDRLITSHQQDMDLDGQIELVTVTLEGSAGSGNGENRLTLSLYEAEGGQAVLQDSVSLDNCYSWYRIEEYILGIRSTDTDVLLYLAGDQDGYLFADGVTQQLTVCRYNGKELESLIDETVSGSDDSWQGDWAQELQNLGFALNMPGDAERWKISPDELEPHFWVMCHGEANVNLEDSLAYAAACREGQEAQANYLLNHAEMQGYARGGDGFVSFGTGWPDVYGTEPSSFLLPESNSRYLTQEDLAGLSTDMLRLARNEIYARHGRIFDSPDLAEYFEHQPWYQGTIPGDQFSESVLNQWERANLELILQEEASRQDAT